MSIAMLILLLACLALLLLWPLFEAAFRADDQAKRACQQWTDAKKGCEAP